MGEPKLIPSHEPSDPFAQPWRTWRAFDADDGEIGAYATKEEAVEALLRLEAVEG